MSRDLGESGRQRETTLIRRANRAAAIGRLMLGQMCSWIEFLQPETERLEYLPRRVLKYGVRDVKRNVNREINKFCERNFEGMTEAKLEQLYIDVAAHRGIEIPVEAFEKRYAPFKPRALRGTPIHATVSISLWGLKFWFPEDELAKDICCSIDLARKAMEAIEPFKKKSHNVLTDKTAELQEYLRLRFYSSRTGLLASFSARSIHVFDARLGKAKRGLFQ